MCAGRPLFCQNSLQKMCKPFVLCLEDCLGCVKILGRTACAPIRCVFFYHLIQQEERSPNKLSSPEFGDRKSFCTKRLKTLPLLTNSRSRLKILKLIAVNDLTKIFVNLPRSGRSNLAGRSL
jgi:hypothetical protein